MSTPSKTAEFHVELRPYRQTWLSLELLHSAPTAELCVIDGKQYAQLSHPRGGPLTCVQNRTGRDASGVERIEGKWCWVFEANEPAHEHDKLAQAAKQALETLEIYVQTYNDYWERGMDILEPQGDAALACLRAAILAHEVKKSSLEDLGEAISKALDDHQAHDVLSILTGAFVSLTVELVRRKGHDVTKSITIDGGERRDVTIHAQKEATP